MGQIDWSTLCDLVQRDDSLPCRDVGAWSEDKLFFWHKYIQLTTAAMVGHPAWPDGLVYVDLFAGPGICRIRESGRRIPGSPLIAAYAPKQFRKIIAVELDPDLSSACAKRLQNSPTSARSVVICGDSNKVVDRVAQQVPRGALTLAFVDPEALHAQFETIKTLAACGRVDLLILFADAFDVVRNVDEYEKDPNSNLDLVLGNDSDWRRDWIALHNRSGANVREFFADIYVRQLRKLEYKQFGTKVISSQRGPLYRLVYASKHPRGLDFWNKVIVKDKGGQGELFGP